MSRLHAVVAVVGIALASALPGHAADDVDAILARLFASDVADAATAANELRALGPRAREGLERWVDPVGAFDRIAPVSADDAAEIDELIANLADPRFAVREQASRDLAGRGDAALPRLRAALADADPERRTRAQQIIALRLPSAPPRGPLGAFPQVEVVLALGWIGDRRSVPALRRALDEPAPEVAAAADFALRVVWGGGPGGMPLEWLTRGNELRAAWDQWMAKAAADGRGSAAGAEPPGPVDCRFAPLANQVGRFVVARTRHEIRIASSPSGASTRVWREDGNEVYCGTVRGGANVQVERRYLAHRSGGEPNGGRVPRTRAVCDASGGLMAFAITAEGCLVYGPQTPQWSEPLPVPGELVMSGLPGGALRVGELVPLPAPLVTRMGALMKTATWRLARPRRPTSSAIGRLRYLGRTGHVDRIHVAMGWLAQPVGDSALCEVALAGTLEIDARTGLLVAHDLAGPMWVARGTQLSYGEQRMEAVLRAPPAPAAGELDARLVGLMDPQASRRVAAARELRTAGEAVRPALEAVLLPPADAPSAAADAAAQVDAYLATSEAALRQGALVAMLARVGPARRVVLDRLAASDATAAETLRTLDRRLWPFDALTIDAALLLAAVGTRESVLPLRAALRSGSPAVVAAADHALRAILGDGPTPADPFWLDAGVLAAAWDAWIAAAESTGGPSAVLAAAPAEGDHASHLGFRVALRTGSARIGGLRLGESILDGVLEGRFRRVAGDSLQLRGRVARYREELAHDGDRTVALAFEDQDLELDADGPTALALRIGGQRHPPTKPARLPLALVWADLLPAGEYAVGEARPIPRSLVDRLRLSMAIPTAPAAALTDSDGRVRYLGRVNGRDRFALSLTMAVEGADERSCDRHAWAGILEIDPARPGVVGVRLAGPGWGQVGDEGASRWTEIAEEELAPTGK